MKEIALIVALVAVLALSVVLERRRQEQDLARIERIKEKRAKQERAQRLLRTPPPPSITITANIDEFMKARNAMVDAIRDDDRRARREHLRRRIPASRSHHTGRSRV